MRQIISTALNTITPRNHVWNDYVVKLVAMRCFVPFVQWDHLLQLDSSLGYDHCHDWLWCHWLSWGLSLILVAGSLHLPCYGWVLDIGLHDFGQSSGPVFTKGLKQGLGINLIHLNSTFKPKPWLSPFVTIGSDGINFYMCKFQGFWAAIAPFNFTAISGHLSGAPAMMVSYIIFRMLMYMTNVLKTMARRGYIVLLQLWWLVTL